ncbi:hypothetical protein BC941DRAFT_410522, partial [Chlamydoabsidia padenii]
MESNIDLPCISCTDEICSTHFKYLDSVIHTKVRNAPDPRDHLANERNFLTWLRTGVTLTLIGFLTAMDLTSKQLAPSTSLPWTNEPMDNKVKIISYVFICFGLVSILLATRTYFNNQKQIVRRLMDVGQGWTGYTLAVFIMVFVCFIMILAISEG